MWADWSRRIPLEDEMVRSNLLSSVADFADHDLLRASILNERPVFITPDEGGDLCVCKIQAN
jgi:hypothetical protein